MTDCGAGQYHSDWASAPAGGKMSLESMTELLRTRVGDESGLGARVKFDFGGDEMILVDATSNPNTVSNEDAEADCTILISMKNFKKLVSGDLNPATAFMMRKIKVEGDMGIAMKLSSVL